MEKSQYRFGLGVGVAVIALGGFVATKASVGLALMALGLALMVITMITGNVAGRASSAGILLPVVIRESREESAC